jgi:hypothetical protein
MAVDKVAKKSDGTEERTGTGANWKPSLRRACVRDRDRAELSAIKLLGCEQSEHGKDGPCDGLVYESSCSPVQSSHQATGCDSIFF